jgi:hypothetical protein
MCNLRQGGFYFLGTQPASRVSKSRLVACGWACGLAQLRSVADNSSRVRDDDVLIL